MISASGRRRAFVGRAGGPCAGCVCVIAGAGIARRSTLVGGSVWGCAAGTNLVVGFLLGVAAFAVHAASLRVDWGVLAAGLAGAIPGGWLGPRATGRFSEDALRLALGIVLLAVGVAFAVQAIARY